MEKFCGTENPHHSRIQEDFGLALVRAKKHLGCPRCLKRAESYEHKFCSVCQHKLVAIVLLKNKKKEEITISYLLMR